MKYFMVFCIVLFAAVAFVHAGEDEFKEEYCKEDVKLKGQCSGWKCNKDNTEGTGIMCPKEQCKGKPLRIEEQDLSKPFPQCCRKVICQE